MFLDLDHFKSINDCHGHAGGDDVLRSFAQSVGSEIRQGEHFARIGGEEFAVLLPQTGLEGAATFAQRLLMKVRAQPADLAGVPVPFTASIGVAALAAGPADEAGAEAAATIDKLMQGADRGLYRCKAGGRDRFEVCQDAS